MAATNGIKADRAIREIMKKLNSELGNVKDGTNKGLHTLALKIERGSKKRAPREYGNLAASGYTRKLEDGKFEVGFTAAYSVHVHENLEMKLKGKARASGKGVYWGPSGEARFLAKAIDEQVPTAAQTIRGEAEIKKGGKSK